MSGRNANGRAMRSNQRRSRSLMQGRPLEQQREEEEEEGSDDDHLFNSRFDFDRENCAPGGLLVAVAEELGRSHSSDGGGGLPRPGELQRTVSEVSVVTDGSGDGDEAEEIKPGNVVKLPLGGHGGKRGGGGTGRGGALVSRGRELEYAL